MIKKISILLMVISCNLFATCCCEGIIIERTQAIDEFLTNKNNNNVNSLDKLLSNIKTLNNNILEDRVSNLDDSQIVKELSKFRINAKNLYHSNSKPMGLLYYQIKKDEFVKDELINAISNQIDIDNINTKIDIETNKNDVYKLNKKLELNKNENTKSTFNIK